MSGQGREPPEPGARTARAFTGWRRSDPMAESLGTQVTTTTPARVSCRNPNAARIAHDALDTGRRRNTSNWRTWERTDVNLGVAADPSYPGAGRFEVRAGAIDAGIIRHVADIGVRCLPNAKVTGSHLCGRAPRNATDDNPRGFGPGVGQRHTSWTAQFAALIARARDPPSRANRRLPPGSLDLSTMVAIAPKGQLHARRPAQPRRTFRSRTPLPAPCRELPLLP